jgi:hypothetical protein
MLFSNIELLGLGEFYGIIIFFLFFNFGIMSVFYGFSKIKSTFKR